MPIDTRLLAIGYCHPTSLDPVRPTAARAVADAHNRRRRWCRVGPWPANGTSGTVLLWWFATGLDNYVADGKGPHTVQALGLALTTKPLAAGTGAFGGLLSTPWPWVAISVLVTFACGALLGVASGALAALATPRRKTEAPAIARPGTA